MGHAGHERRCVSAGSVLLPGGEGPCLRSQGLAEPAAIGSGCAIQSALATTPEAPHAPSLRQTIFRAPSTRAQPRCARKIWSESSPCARMPNVTLIWKPVQKNDPSRPFGMAWAVHPGEWMLSIWVMGMDVFIISQLPQIVKG